MLSIRIKEQKIFRNRFDYMIILRNTNKLVYNVTIYDKISL